MQCIAVLCFSLYCIVSHCIGLLFIALQSIALYWCVWGRATGLVSTRRSTEGGRGQIAAICLFSNLWNAFLRRENKSGRGEEQNISTNCCFSLLFFGINCQPCSWLYSWGKHKNKFYWQFLHFSFALRCILAEKHSPGLVLHKIANQQLSWGGQSTVMGLGFTYFAVKYLSLLSKSQTSAFEWAFLFSFFGKWQLSVPSSGSLKGQS